MQAFSLSFSIVFSLREPIKYIGSKRSNLIAENLFFYDTKQDFRKFALSDLQNMI